ncbi:chondroitin sulfate N-acetylgalactosaminyltransferase 1-like [Oppia nitens]|uniref:chondroitin sulfate N-acetylgalactosaminyltransferase 1-like n=1 Tax=Oppia nitens TaxID=1686743 RepID=UPI0023DA8D30|nr:chondroitin sulfate N-acetylgalactosaminyltransferase 1-like [Oppia nitens]
MINLMPNSLKSICLRSMLLCICKTTVHRRRSHYYMFYGFVVVVFTLLVIAWMIILAQLSTTLTDNTFAKNIVSDSFDSTIPSVESVSKLLDSYRLEIARLQTQIEDLKKSQKQYSMIMDSVVRHVDHIKHGGVTTLSHEYEVVPFTHFTLTRIYPSTLALGKRVVEKPIGVKRKEIIDVLSEALKYLVNFNRTADDFIEGVYATDPLIGTQYHLYFRTAKKGLSASKYYHKITLLRPFVGNRIVSNELISTQQEVIHLILPLSEDRLHHLPQFMDNVNRLSKSESGRLKLFIVYFGDISLLPNYCCADVFNGHNKTLSNINLNKVYDSSSKLTKNFSSIQIKIIHLSNISEDFSRAKALHLGAEICCKNSSLLFFCDVDLLFTNKFLERCRLNASKGKKVYYPILFSLYNPKYSKMKIPNMRDDSISPNLSNLISSQTGFWRDFGFGMTCQYKHDFMSIGGFAEYLVSNWDNNHNIHNTNKRITRLLTQSKLSTGWGGEDVLLYRRHLQHPKLSVIRAIDPGLFHIWHQKQCDVNTLTDEQYSSCLSTRAINEASHSQMAQQLMQFKLKDNKSSNK